MVANGFRDLSRFDYAETELRRANLQVQPTYKSLTVLMDENEIKEGESYASIYRTLYFIFTYLYIVHASTFNTPTSYHK